MVASFKLLISRVSFCRFLHPRSIHIESVTCLEKERGGRGSETNKQRVRLSGTHGVVTQMKRRERERNSCIKNDDEREVVAKSGSPLCLLSLDGNVLLHSFFD